MSVENSHAVTITLTPDEYDRVCQIAADEERTIEQQVRFYVRRGLDQQVLTDKIKGLFKPREKAPGE